MEEKKLVGSVACLCVFLQLCGALDVTCTVTQDAHQTTYSISDPSQVFDKNATGCEYSWTNASNHVFADHVDKIPPVTVNSITTLVASKCIGNMTLARRCVSEGRDYFVPCTTTCSGNDGLFPKTVVILSCAAIAVVVLLVTIFLCCKYKYKRMCSCMQTGGFYASVKMQSDPPAAIIA